MHLSPLLSTSAHSEHPPQIQALDEIGPGEPLAAGTPRVGVLGFMGRFCASAERAGGGAARGCVPVTQLESINRSTLELRTLGFASGSH